jgi:hypothetical protein
MVSVSPGSTDDPVLISTIKYTLGALRSDLALGLTAKVASDRSQAVHVLLATDFHGDVWLDIAI